MLRYFPVAISMFLLIGLWSSNVTAQEPTEPESNEETTPAEPYHGPPNTSPPLVGIPTIDQRNSAEDKSVREGTTEYEENDLIFQRRMAEASKWQAILLGFEVLLLGLTVFFAFWAVQHARNAAESAKGMLKSQNMGNAGWLCLNQTHTTRMTDGPNVISYRIKSQWINAGKTPVIDARFSVQIKIGEPGFDVDVIDFDQAKRPFGTVIGPGTFFHPPRITVPIDTILAVADKKADLLYWVKVDYKDIFDMPHTTELCVQVVYDGNVTDLTNADMDPDKLRFEFQPVGPHNYAK